MPQKFKEGAGGERAMKFVQEREVIYLSNSRKGFILEEITFGKSLREQVVL